MIFYVQLDLWNRISKHFMISLNFPCLSLFTVLFAYVVFWYFCGEVFV